MTRPLVIVGAGGFGRETIDTVRAINSGSPTWDVIGVIDDSPSELNLQRLRQLGVEYLGGVDQVPDDAAVALCVGSPAARAGLAARLSHSVDFPSLIHPSTTSGSHFRHGRGLITLAGVSIGTNVEVSDHVHLNAHAVIGHDTRLLDFVSVNPNATVSGDCLVGAGTLIGASSTVLQQITVGEGSVVGAAACVVSDVAPRTTVKGVPAR